MVSRAGKGRKMRWGGSYNIQDLGLEQVSWIDMKEYKEFRKIPEEEEVTRWL